MVSRINRAEQAHPSAMGEHEKTYRGVSYIHTARRSTLFMAVRYTLTRCARGYIKVVDTRRETGDDI